MTTFTDKELIKEIKERIGSLDVRDNIERRAYEIALASLEAEPVAYIFKHPAGKLFWALTDESNKDQSDVIPVYAAPPVPVVPAALPENDDEDGHDIDYLEPSEVYSLGRTAGWNACRAAMLHGAEPVSQTYKLPPLSSNEVNDAAWKLRNMLTEHGPLNGRQFNNLKSCFYEALKVAMRNSPVTPDGLSTVCAEAYQVVGVMADALGVFGDAAVQKVLDNLSQQKLVHRDVLPFSLPVTPDGWISCSERMPEMGERQCYVLAADFKNNYPPNIPNTQVGVYGDWFNDGNPTWDDGDGEDLYLKEVTHWMPLPEPPQEVDRG